MELKATGLACGPWSTICEHNYSHRRRRLREKLDGETGYYTTHLPNIRYLTGFWATSAALLISEKKSCLLVDGRYKLYADNFRFEDIEVIKYKSSRLGTLNGWLENCGIDSLHFEKNNLTYTGFRKIVNKLELKDRTYGKDLIAGLRIAKDETELNLIRLAASKTEKILVELEDWLEWGKTEKQIGRFLRARLEKNGESRSFYPLVLSGPRTAMPHAPPAGKVWKKGEALLVDIGLKIEGYCADLTRMYFSGEKDVKIKPLYELSMRAAYSAFKKIKPGIPVEKITRAAYDLVVEEQGEDCIRHGLGHGLGLQIHESPALKDNSSRVLKKGMVITIEPGIYLDNTGGARVEHMVLVTDKGAELIDSPANNFEKELYQ